MISAITYIIERVHVKRLILLLTLLILLLVKRLIDIIITISCGMIKPITKKHIIIDTGNKKIQTNLSFIAPVLIIFIVIIGTLINTDVIK